MFPKGTLRTPAFVKAKTRTTQANPQVGESGESQGYGYFLSVSYGHSGRAFV